MKDLNGNPKICERTQKICYTQKEAGLIINSCRKHGYKKWGVEQKNNPMRKYHCEFCKCWHTSHYKSYFGNNPKNKKLKVLMSAVLFCLVFMSCVKKAPVQSAASAISITDYADRTVTLSKAAEKIIVMADNSLVVVKQLKAIDKVIAP